MHVVKEVTVERPVAERIGGEIEGRSPTRLDEHGVLAWRPVALAGDQFEEMTVQVDRVAHHRIVDEVHPHPFALQKRDRFVMIRHLHAIERPTRSEEHTSELQSLMRISYAV